VGKSGNFGGGGGKKDILENQFARNLCLFAYLCPTRNFPDITNIF